MEPFNDGQSIDNNDTLAIYVDKVLNEEKQKQVDEKKRQEDEEAIKALIEAYDKSVTASIIERKTQAQKALIKKKMIFVFLATASFCASVLIANLAIKQNDTTTAIFNNNIEISKESKEYVNNRIKYFKQIMGSKSDYSEYQVVKKAGINQYDGGIIYEYDENSLNNIISKAANISEEELRLAIYSATQILPKSKIDSFLNEVLKNNTIQSENTNKELLNNGWYGYIINLGYLNTDDYLENEKKCIEIYHTNNKGENNGNHRSL